MSDSDSPEAFSAHIRNALIKGFAVPVVLLVFFTSATAWLNHNLREDFIASISHQGELTPEARAQRVAIIGKLDFAEVCGSQHPNLVSLRGILESNGICRQFLWLRWGAWLSLVLIVVLAGVATTIHFLNRRAQRSSADLIKAYRQAWHLSMAASLLQLVLLIPLITYGTFEAMVLATDHYVPKIILAIVLAGIIGLWRGLHVLFHRVPLEFQAPMARAVTPEEAPALWVDVRAAAARLGTAPPDHIIVGMEHSFYVTELAVHHRDGKTGGRTLYLSHPLMQQLSPEEVLAVIGHELGHFRGDDTRLTREFYPMRFKVEATLLALSEAVLVSWTSINSLLFFRGSFGRSEQALSRERELLADRTAAELTSPTIIARALTKIHVFSEAFGRKLESGTANPFATPLAAFVRSSLASEAAFWDRLFEHKAAHPLDSHPSLRVRLEALGQPADADTARGVFTVDSEIAYAKWFAGRDELFVGITAEAMEAIGRMHVVQANYATPEGQKLLDQHFPEVRWPMRPGSLWFKVVVCGLVVALGLFLPFIIPDWGFRVGSVAVALVSGLAIVQQWRRHHGGEFVLKPDCLTYTGWHHPLVFAAVASINVQNNSGSFTIMFHLKEKAPGIWKWSPFNFMQHRVVSLPLGLLPGKHPANAETIYRYFTHQPA